MSKSGRPDRGRSKAEAEVWTQSLRDYFTRPFRDALGPTFDTEDAMRALEASEKTKQQKQNRLVARQAKAIAQAIAEAQPARSKPGPSARSDWSKWRKAYERMVKGGMDPILAQDILTELAVHEVPITADHFRRAVFRGNKVDLPG